MPLDFKVRQSVHISYSLDHINVLLPLFCCFLHRPLKLTLSPPLPTDTLDDPELDATIFIPNNAAFTLFLEQADGTAEDLLAFPGLADILKYHVHIVAHNISDINEGDNLDTLQGDEIFVQFKKDNDPKYAGCGGAHLHLSTFGSSPSDPLTCDIQACKVSQSVHLSVYWNFS